MKIDVGAPIVLFRGERQIHFADIADWRYQSMPATERTHCGRRRGTVVLFCEWMIGAAFSFPFCPDCRRRCAHLKVPKFWTVPNYPKRRRHGRVNLV